MRQRYLLDASVLVGIVNSDDPLHQPCYSFFRNLYDEDAAVWVVPGIIFFEFQATQSRRARERGQTGSIYRHAPLFENNTELYEISPDFLGRVWDAELYTRFDRLRGADLLYACIAFLEGIPLVTHDSDFDPYSGILSIIRPREVYDLGGNPI